MPGDIAGIPGAAKPDASGFSASNRQMSSAGT